MVATSKTDNPGIAAGTAAAAPPLSPAQERLWFLDQINPGDASLNIARAVSIEGVLDRDRLERCLNQIVQRHESLRTTFATTQLYAGIDSKPVQIVADAVTIPINFVEEVDLNLPRLLREKAQHRFDLSLGPLIHATLIKLAEQSHILLIVAHRIIADEESLRILFRELFRMYAGTDLSPLSLQYSDYAARQLNALGSEAARAAIDYWRETLQGAPPALELPGYHLQTGLRTSAGATVPTRLNDTLASSLRTFSENEQVPLCTTLLAAFMVLLSHYSGQKDLVVGLETANRHDEELRNLIGAIANLLPLTIDLASQEPFTHVLARLQAITIDAGARSLPFEKLLDELNVERSLSRPPLVQITFNHRAADHTTLQADSLTIEEFDFDTGVNNFELTLDVVERVDSIDCRFSYNAEIYSAAMIERMAKHFQTLLEAIVAEPEQRIGELPLLTASEREQVLMGWNQTAVSFPEKQSIQQLFEEQVTRTPKAVAVVDQQQS
jgi:hypothetical protein